MKWLLFKKEVHLCKKYVKCHFPQIAIYTHLLCSPTHPSMQSCNMCSCFMGDAIHDYECRHISYLKRGNREATCSSEWPPSLQGHSDEHMASQFHGLRYLGHMYSCLGAMFNYFFFQEWKNASTHTYMHTRVSS